MGRVFSLFLIVMIASGLQAQTDKRFPEPLSARTSNYDIDLRLDIEEKKVYASQTMTFRNPSSDTIWTMPFHMYYNAFKNNRSDFFLESSRVPRDISEEDKKNGTWAWIKVTEVKDSLGNDLLPESAFVQPDDDNKDDHTVWEVRLKEPVLPYATYTLDMKWESQIPRLMIRTGYSKDFFFMVQWYPKLGVYEPAGSRFAKEGAWNCHQYHGATEYFGEFGVYEVSIEAPKEFVVGASGFLLEKEEKGENAIHTYLAEDVIDFAWTACPRFEEIVEEWNGMELKLLIMPEHTCNKERFLASAKNSFTYFEENLGKYPYPTFTIVSPPYYGLRAGAMEYPTLITSPTLCDLPEGIRTTETLTIHELTHQYFMQMLATNEQEEPWMDEGFTSYYEGKILDKYNDGVVSFPGLGLQIGGAEFRRGRFFNAENIQVNPMSDFGWHFKHGSYSQIVYGKGAVTLHTLEGLVGEDVMKKIMRTYFERWKFKHPCRNDFLTIVEEITLEENGTVSSEMVMSFLDQAITGTEVCDYKVGSIQITPVEKPLGFFEDTENPEVLKEGDGTGLFKSKVTLFRMGGIMVSQDVDITFDNGETIRETWDGKARSHDFTYVRPEKVIAAVIDPEGKITMDKNLLNNGIVEEQENTGIMRYAAAFFTQMQRIMTNMSFLI